MSVIFSWRFSWLHPEGDTLRRIGTFEIDDQGFSSRRHSVLSEKGSDFAPPAGLGFAAPVRPPPLVYEGVIGFGGRWHHR